MSLDNRQVIPSHVIKYWRRQGKSWEWINDRNDAILKDWRERNACPEQEGPPPRPKMRVSLICQGCKESFSVIPSQQGQRKYCSRQCAGKYAYSGKKLPDIGELLELYKVFTTVEIGKMYGVTRQAVAQALAKSPDYEPYSPAKIRQKLVYQLYQQGVSIVRIAERVGLKEGSVKGILYRCGVKFRRAKPIGCGNCKTDEYARGLCKNCYQRWIRRGKPDLEIVREPYK